MIYEEKNFDKFIFLMSSDWCLPFLSTDLELDSHHMGLVKDAARKCVQHIMASGSDNNNYYEANLSADRKKKTWDIFVNALNSLSLQKKIEVFISGGECSSDDEILSIFWLFIEDEFFHIKDRNHFFLTDKKVIELSTIVKSVIDDDISVYENTEISSTTKWDRYLASTTPEIPSALSDFYSIDVSNKSNFKKFWSQSILILNDDEQPKLILFLTKRYEELTEEKCVLPNWLGP